MLRSRAERAAVIEWVAVFASWLMYVAIASPVPSVNEPHYLTKARHFIQPEWCAGDLFLDSSNPHAVFYALIGPLTLVLPFPLVAWLGRALALAIVASGWCRLRAALELPHRVSLLAAWLFLLCQSIGNFSGEWVIGGLESKVFTYGFLMWSVATWILNRPIRAGMLAGLAVALHPVVGLWGLLAASGSGLWLAVVGGVRSAENVAWGRKLLGLLALVLLALPGILPVIPLVLADVDPQVKYAGTYLQVFYRLGHHLDPMQFPARAYIGYAVLTAVWLVGWWWSRAKTETGSATRRTISWLQGIVLWSLVFAVCGVLVGWGPRPPQEMPWFEQRMQLLKFYPFRLFDALLPFALAWMFATAWISTNNVAYGMRRRDAGLLATLVLATLSIIVWQQWQAPPAPDDHPDWIAACEWIRSETPTDVLVQTPHGCTTFKWYAQRPEYVNQKDCPQDVASIVEWNRRLNYQGKWFHDHRLDGSYSREELAELNRATGITHILTDRLGPMEQPPVYQNDTYRVYDLKTAQP